MKLKRKMHFVLKIEEYTKIFQQRRSISFDSCHYMNTVARNDMSKNKLTKKNHNW